VIPDGGGVLRVLGGSTLLAVRVAAQLVARLLGVHQDEGWDGAI
jgi:hypothetical protein